MNNQQVAHAWAHGQKGKGSNLSTDGVILTSYSTVIAAKIGDTIYISSNNMSLTTGRHISYARRAVDHLRENIFYTPAFTRFGNNPRLSHRDMITPAIREAMIHVEIVTGSTRARRITKERTVRDYMARRTEIMAIAERTGTTIPTMPEMQYDEESIKNYYLQIEARQAEARQAEARRREQKRDEDAEQFANWLNGAAANFPYSYNGTGTDYLRLAVDGETVVTSHGAECPLIHVRKALEFYNGLTADGITFKPWQTNGHRVPLGMFTLDSVDAAGNVRAGCHYFTVAEIARFVNRWIKEV